MTDDYPDYILGETEETDRIIEAIDKAAVRIEAALADIAKAIREKD